LGTEECSVDVICGIVEKLVSRVGLVVGFDNAINGNSGASNNA
jgi:hypothetical protein